MSIMDRVLDSTPRASSAKQNLVEGAVLGIFLTMLSYVVGLSAGWISSLNYVEVFAVFTSYWCTYLCVKERRINYPIGAISTAAYCLLFVQSNLVASAVLNAYLTPTLAYGWFRWRQDAVTRPVEHVRLKWLPVYLVVTFVAYMGATAIVKALGGSQAWTDSAILAGTVLAQFLLDNKKWENWFVWAAVNVLAIYTYFTAGLPLVGFQYIFFLANTVYGMVVWTRSMRASRTEPVVEEEAVITPVVKREYQTPSWV